jgi:DNA-directed RNA polymerase subunit M/transcription elongation factor TFIIS
MAGEALTDLANVERGVACPHCAGHKTWLTRMRWADGREVQFWSCDACRLTFSREEREDVDGSDRD